MRWMMILLAAGATACASTPESSTSSATSLAVPTAPAEPFVLTSMDGGAVDVGSALASGRRVALVFWQTWCSSCIKEAPKLVSASAEYKGQIDFLGVISGPDDTVDDALVRKVATKLELPYAQIRDRDGALSTRYEVTGTPTIIVLGAGGEVLFNGHHSPDWSVMVAPSESR